MCFGLEENTFPGIFQGVCLLIKLIFKDISLVRSQSYNPKLWTNEKFPMTVSQVCESVCFSVTYRGDHLPICQKFPFAKYTTPLLLIEYELYHKHNNDRIELNIFGEENKLGGREPRAEEANNPLNLHENCTGNELKSLKN